MKKIVLFIVLAQFFGTSLWFVGNIVIPQLPGAQNNPDVVSQALSAVQIGFILGTLIYAFLAIADRFSPSKVFFFSAVFAALANALLIISNLNVELLISTRIITGFFLAGIYPVGMKIASDYFEKGLGLTLGLLVGALVLGTALPYAIQLGDISYDPRIIVLTTSILAILGGILILIFVPDGPFRKKQSKLDFGLLPKIFKQNDFRKAAFGYFGHMWELYTFWGLLPLFLISLKAKTNLQFELPLWCFAIIGIGCISCFIGGFISIKKGSKWVASLALILSGICCFVSPLLFNFGPMPAAWQVSLSFIILLIWGFAVVMDSPQLSTLVAQSTAPELRGTALTITNCIGYAITIASIQVVSWLSNFIEPQYFFVVLGLGPIFGLINLLKLRSR